MACSSPDTQSEAVTDLDISEASFLEEEGASNAEAATSKEAESPPARIVDLKADEPTGTGQSLDKNKDPEIGKGESPRKWMKRDDFDVERIPTGTGMASAMPSLNLERKNQISRNVEKEMQILLS
ncbi:MAG: hypothetical protein ABIK28_01035, partial [Planctomycetota bacterium]